MIVEVLTVPHMTTDPSSPVAAPPARRA